MNWFYSGHLINVVKVIAQPPRLVNTYSISLSVILLFSLTSNAQTNVLTQHNDLKRTGWNNQETILHTKNVKPGVFGKLFSCSVDDQIYAQPLVMNINLPGKGNKNVVFIATVNNSVYAFDADSANVADPYWKVNLSPDGTRAVKNTDMTGACGGGYRDFSGNMGIVGTPVIDPVTNTLYVVARSVNTVNKFEQHLHALDVSTGAEKFNGPKLITANVPGQGDGSVGGFIEFNPQKQNQRSALMLLNGIVYITYASHCDWGPYHGWILGYDKNDLSQKTVYNATPEGFNGGIWMSGAGPSADESGNIYVAVGNGSVGFSGNPSNPINRSESALKLTPSGSTLSVASFFTPKNYPSLEVADLDFGVTQVLLIPGTNRAVTGCKDGRIYLLDRNSMGGFSSSVNNVIQTIDLGTNAYLRSSLGYYKGEQKEFLYSWSENTLLKAYPYNRGSAMFDLGNTISSGIQGPTGNNGAVMSISSNASIDSTAILWTSYAANGDANQSVRPGILRAFKATDVTQELWNSSQYADDAVGNYAKFNCPTVANGKVYLATFSNKLNVYGVNGTFAIQCTASNKALSKTTVATSSQPNNPPTAAVDGDPATTFVTASDGLQSLTIDLGVRHDICSVVLHWQNAVSRDFGIQVSDDAIHWMTQVNFTTNSLLENSIPLSVTSRFVRMNATRIAAGQFYSLSEVEVKGNVSAKSCAEPNNLSVTNIYENTATLHWNGNDASGFNVQYKTVSAATWTTIPSDTTFLIITGLACATDYLFQVQGICDVNHVSDYSKSSAFSALSCNSNCNPLPTRWITLDVGDVAFAGSACYDNGVFKLNGSGDDIWNMQDAFRFSYKTLIGDGEIQAHVLTMDQSDVWNKCGIMIRESLTPGSRHAFVTLTSGNGVSFQNRTSTEANSNSISSLSKKPPYWLKLKKQGTLYTAYCSPDGIVWGQVGNIVDAGFGNGIPVYAGLAITSHNNNKLSTATVDGYLFSGVIEIELQSFTASLTLDKTVLLQWATTLENNIEKFVIERSTSLSNFIDLDTVTATSNGRFSKTYNFEDKNPIQTRSYYRLRILDKKGVTSYSAPVSISVVTSTVANIIETPPSVYSNPTQQGVVHVRQGQGQIKMITLYDYNGRVVTIIRNVSSEVTDIPVNNYSNGLYIIEIRTNKALFKDRLMIKN